MGANATRRQAFGPNATPLTGVGCWADSGRCVQAENAIFGFTKPRKREKTMKNNMQTIMKMHETEQYDLDLNI